MLEEFKKFVVRGNMIDMAVGIVIGAAFGTVIQSLVDDIIMPPIGLLLGGVDFSNLFITLGPGDYQTLAQAQEAGHSVQAELQLLAVHGVLHLLGYDDSTEERRAQMWAVQAEILQALPVNVNLPA